MKYALVDLGSNTVRLTLYNVHTDGSFESLFSEKRMAGLVSYVKDGCLSYEGILVACDVIQEFQALLRQFGVDKMYVFATASLRNIDNTDEAVAGILKRTGLHVDVISGEEEAELSYYGSLKSCPITSGAIFDIGGGSTEIIEVNDGVFHCAGSFSIGSLNLFNQYVTKIWPKQSEIINIQTKIMRVFEKVPFQDKRFKNVCGVGGTARAVMKIANRYFEKPSGNKLITTKELEAISSVLLARERTARDLILKACPDRIHTILPGILLMGMVCQFLGSKNIYVSQFGVREGYLCRKLIISGNSVIPKTVS